MLGVVKRLLAGKIKLKLLIQVVVLFRKVPNFHTLRLH